MKTFSSCLIIAVVLGVAIDRSSMGMDLVRKVTRTDDAVAKYGVTGKGVTVAIADRGIDWKHPDFIKPDGKTRIKWLLDMTGQRGCPGNPPGKEYSEAEINAALAGGTSIPSDDFVGHGTVTAGLAAGNGRAFANGKYRGMAPEADLLIVKLAGGAPAHDGIPAEPSFFACTDDALTWIDAKVTALGQPAVATFNIGTQYGPIDGTEAFSRRVSQLFGLDRPGRIFVAPPGDEGRLPNHAGGTYDSGADTVVRIHKATTTTSYTTLWYTGTKPALITVTFDDGTTVGPVGPGASLNQNGIAISHYNVGQDFWRSTSGDRAVLMVISGHTATGTIRIRGLQSGTGRFDLYGDISGPAHLTSNVTFADHLVAGRLSNLASTLSAIVPAVAINRRTYLDLDSISRLGFGDDAGIGALWAQSPGGPTRDGRLGVDVTVPGDSVFAAYGQNSYWKSGRYNLISDGGAWYGRGGGGSGSGPVMTGAVALMLQLNPTITARQIKQLLQQTSYADQFTGVTPNNDWGYGKLDMVKVLDGAISLSPTGSTPSTLALTTGGASRLSTAGAATTTRAGYATVTVNSGVAPYGTAVFSVTQNGVVVSEAGVPAMPPTQNARIFIDYRIGTTGTGVLNISTGFAVANRGGSTATLTYTLRDGTGQVIATGLGTLATGRHYAKFIHELHDVAAGFHVPANFATVTSFGTLDIASTRPISVVPLRLTTNQRGETLLTSTSMADLAAGVQTTPLYLPQLADGGGYTTTLNLMNTSSTTQSGRFSIFDDNGDPLVLRDTHGTSAATFPYSISANGSFVFQTDGSATVTKIGWVRLMPNVGSTPIGAGIFSFSRAGVLVTESGAPSARPTRRARIYLDKSGGHDTGIALANPSGFPASIVIEAFEPDGSTRAGSGSATLTIAPNGHVGKFVGQMIVGLPDGFTGVVEVSSPSDFVALTLRSLVNSRGDFLLTTFPVADATQAAPFPIVFPQIADGGGYLTQVILISPTGPASVSVNFFGEDGAPLSVQALPHP